MHYLTQSYIFTLELQNRYSKKLPAASITKFSKDTSSKPLKSKAQERHSLPTSVLSCVSVYEIWHKSHGDVFSKQLAENLPEERTLISKSLC